MKLPIDYVERVYAGVLGKLIGVYLGRPFENWTHEQIMSQLGEITYYINDRDVPGLKNRTLVVPDDDISGTFTFLRALPDNGNRRDLTAAQIGDTWLNYLIKERAVLWWGGLGNSTEHTAYLRLKKGIRAPLSGAMSTNTKVVAEQIGSQIFVDGWAMVAPGDPEMAADLARRAASVSHDGEAIYGAQAVAAMEALAFVTSDIEQLLNTAVSLIPKDSVICRMIEEIRNWHRIDRDWRKTRKRIVDHYGYDKYGGNCHIVPNHALIILGLLYGDGDFQKSLSITNTCGWDTDCNSGNLGCLLGIRNGLAGFSAGPDWRGPIADRLYLPTADGGRCITDAVRETIYIVNSGRALAGLKPIKPKNAARFHFELAGSVQGFRTEDSPECRDTVTLENVLGHSETGERSLAIRYRHIEPGRVARVATATFIPTESITLHRAYALRASPTIYPGQQLLARIVADNTNRSPVVCRLYLRMYGEKDLLVREYGPEAVLKPGGAHEFVWHIGDTRGAPIAEVGFEISSAQRAHGTLYLDYLTWHGTPDVTFGAPPWEGNLWKRAWVDAMDVVEFRPPLTYWMIQNSGVGLLIQGTRDWTDYQVSADIQLHMAESAGLAARVQGMRRYYAFLLGRDGKARLVKTWDTAQTILAQADIPFEFDRKYALTIAVKGDSLCCRIDDQVILDVRDRQTPLLDGAIAMVCEEGRAEVGPVHVKPLE